MYREVAVFVTALPTSMETAASGLAAIGSAVTAGNAAGAPLTMGVLPPAAEPASALLAAAFGTHAGVYQVTQAIGAVIHEMFVATLGASAAGYAAAEALNAAAMA
ncbi:PE family protein [Mycobacterium simiae]|uniref:PE family protein n=2 Tax=Mycobacterium simiae TaxID=1784 RepID=A0A5B1B1Y1_MYCSI|nr:PE family protein [Mycobacterium simiae]KAA1242667.1 PE family protein [Mycobacterium simiae]